MMFFERSEKIRAWLEGYKFEPLAVMPIAFILFLFLVDAYDPDTLAAGLAMVVAISPVWLPIYFFVFFWMSWIDYIRYLFWFSQDHVVLEVQLPQAIDKSPVAVETFLTTMHNAGGETTAINRMWKGSFRPIWSLEIASNEGRIGYYIHLRRVWRSIVEARLYGQFPEAKITEVEDYASKIPFSLEEYDIFGAEYKKGATVRDAAGKPIPIDALPIRTYIDWGLHQNPKEEQKVDPITNILELLGQVGKNEYFWIQIILKTRRNGSEWYGFRGSRDNFNTQATLAVESIMANAAKRAKRVLTEFNVEQGRMVTMTKNESQRVEQIERSLAKLIFECGIRVVYLAKKENYKGINGGAIIRFFDTFKAQTDSREYNSLGATRGTTIFDYPWQDFMGIRAKIIKEDLFFQYKNRAYFYVPYDQVPVYMSTEELATLWHFPSAVIVTPGLNRVPSRRAEAPVNLPTG